jgi:hypothetical protein
VAESEPAPGKGAVRRYPNAVGVKVHGGWTVVWLDFTDGTSNRGYFYSDGTRTAVWISEGEPMSTRQAADG